MKIAGVALFILFTTIFCSHRLYAQNNLFNSSDLSNINIDTYSDEELNSMLEKARESGLSESQLIKLAADRGLPASEITKLRNRLQLISTNGGSIKNRNEEIVK